MDPNLIRGGGRLHDIVREEMLEMRGWWCEERFQAEEPAPSRC